MKRQYKNYQNYEVIPFSDFKEMLTQATELGKEKPAFRFKENGHQFEKTYEKFEKDTQKLGTALADLNFADKHIAIVSGNCYQYIVTYLSVLNSSGVFVPIDKELPFDEIINIVNHSDSEVFFYSSAYRDNVLKRKDKMPKVKIFVILDEEEKEKNDKFTSYNDLMLNGEKLLNQNNRDYLDLVPNKNALKMIVYTSGTTGTSKGVMLSVKNLVSCVYYGLQISTVYDTCLSALPYHHTYESVCGILVSIHKASTICINENLRTIATNLKLYQPSYIMLVPLFVESFYKKIWAEAESKGKDKALKMLMKLSNALLKVGIDMRKIFFKSIHDVFGGKMKKLVCGGAPIRKELGDFFETIGITLINGYGISECSPLVAVNRDYFYDFNSVGVKLPCLDIKIDSPNEDGEGEICVKGDTVMLGYYKKPIETDEVLEKSGWFHTGDYGKIDDLDRLYITGRKKNLIVLKNGKNIYPEEIEDYIMGLQQVKEVIVSAIKNNEGEETSLCAEIFPSEEISKDLHDDEIYKIIKSKVEELNEKLPKYKEIHHVKIRKIPFNKTTTGKIKREYTK